MKTTSTKENTGTVLEELISSFDCDYDEMNKIADLLNESNYPIESYTTSIEEFRQAGLNAIKEIYDMQ